MWYEMKRTFIDAAAWVMWVDAYANRREELIDLFRSGELSMDWPDQTTQEYVAERGWPHSVAGVEWTDVVPPTPDYARLEAAILLGKLEAANGAGLAVIVEAARKADNDQPIDVEEFASDVAMMALGHCVSWFDDHARFSIDRACGGCSLHDRSGGMMPHPFKVPHVEFTYEDGEEAVQS